MSQGNFMALLLFAAFFVYISAKNSLPKYLAIFGAGAGGSSAAPAPAATGALDNLFPPPAGAAFGGIASTISALSAG